MLNEVVIRVIDSQIGEKRYVYDEPGVCVVGRAYDCDIQVPSDDEHLQVSRHHCLLEINPPEVVVHDLGSTNGTFVNGRKIGQWPRDAETEAPPEDLFPVELKDGDEVQVAAPALRLRVEVHTDNPAIA